MDNGESTFNLSFFFSLAHFLEILNSIVSNLGSISFDLEFEYE